MAIEAPCCGSLVKTLTHLAAPALDPQTTQRLIQFTVNGFTEASWEYGAPAAC